MVAYEDIFFFQCFTLKFYIKREKDIKSQKNKKCYNNVSFIAFQFVTIKLFNYKADEKIWEL